MDPLSRDLIRAEVDANNSRDDTLSYLASHGPGVERDWSHSDPATLHSSPSEGVTPTFTVRSMGCILRGERWLTGNQHTTQHELHPVELDRISRQRTQHQLTVGSRPDAAGRQRSTATIMTLGAGKPVPPRDEKEEYLVEFDGVDDPAHPQNWPFRTKYNFS